MTKFIIEHLEPKLWKWCIVEYSHISEFVGKDNLVFTNIKSPADKKKLSKIGHVYNEPIKELSLQNLCILDPGSPKTLSPKDAKFDYILLGGILGDFPMKKRTKKELTDKLDYPTRNLGKNQMSTNTAAYVAWKIINGTPLKQIKFIRKLVVKVSDSEEIELPFKFVIENDKPVLAKGYIQLVKEKGF
jgi:ribosome biogenesis SPOUT family RNA methylase Rps3